MAGELNKNAFVHVAYWVVENGPESVELASWGADKNSFVHVASSDKSHLFALAPQGFSPYHLPLVAAISCLLVAYSLLVVAIGCLLAAY